MKLLPILTTLVVSLPAAAAAQDLAVHTGVPIVLSFMGQTSSDGTTDRDLSAHVGADLTWDMNDVFQLGGSIDGSYIDGSFRGVDGILYAISGGPMGLWTSEKWTGRKVVFGFGVTPGFMVYGASGGEGQSITALTVGGLAEASVRFRLTQSFSFGGFGSFGYYGPPLGEDVWRGEQLGSTLLAGVDIGFVWHF